MPIQILLEFIKAMLGGILVFGLCNLGAYPGSVLSKDMAAMEGGFWMGWRSGGSGIASQSSTGLVLKWFYTSVH